AAKALAVLAACHTHGWVERLAQPTAPEDLPGDPRARAIALPLLAHLGLIDADAERVVLSRSGRALAERGWPTHLALDALGDLARMAWTMGQGGPVRDAEGRSKGTTGGVRPDDREAS